MILLCDSVSCWIMGYEELAGRLERALGRRASGETTADGRFTLLPIACLGACDHAPALMIDEDLHADVDARATWTRFSSATRTDTESMHGDSR